MWECIGEKARDMGAHSETDAMDNIFEQNAKVLDRMVRHFKSQPGPLGAILRVSGRSVGLDIFDKSSTFDALFPKLIRSYGINALEAKQHVESAPSTEAAQGFLDSLSTGKLDTHGAIGLGEDIRIAETDAIAGDLIVDSHLVHLGAFTELKYAHP